MDPITAAIVAGVAAGATQVGKEVIVDAYKALKGAIKKKFGADSDLAEAVEKLEQKPDSAGWKEEVETQVKATKAAADSELLQLAQALIEALKSTPKGAEEVSKFKIDARGAQIGIIGDDAKVEGGMHFGKPSNE